jgi:hypothetical protein
VHGNRRYAGVSGGQRPLQRPGAAIRYSRRSAAVRRRGWYSGERPRAGAKLESRRQLTWPVSGFCTYTVHNSRTAPSEIRPVRTSAPYRCTTREGGAKRFSEERVLHRAGTRARRLQAPDCPTVLEAVQVQPEDVPSRGGCRLRTAPAGAAGGGWPGLPLAVAPCQAAAHRIPLGGMVPMGGDGALLRQHILLLEPEGEARRCEGWVVRARRRGAPRVGWSGWRRGRPGRAGRAGVVGRARGTTRRRGGAAGRAREWRP